MAFTPPKAQELRSALQHDGYVCIPQAFSGGRLEAYREAARRTTDMARSGKWPFLRTLPKQFPPWTQDPSDGIWGVQHLLHPDLPERTVFAESYFNDTVVSMITDLLQCERSDLVMELYNMLVRPDRDFALRWHRDDIAPDVSSEEEEARLLEPMLHAQWNLALFDDSSLIVVPKSHKRARTDVERNADPYEDDMPGQKVVKMRAGDVVFYNNNILHRGVYDSRTERMTLHGSMGLAGSDKARARNIMQHGIGTWAGEASFDFLLPDMAVLANSMQDRLVKMGRSKDVGYSQTD